MLAGATGVIFALPAIGQQGPESLLPPGFGEPPAPQPTPLRPQPNIPKTSGDNATQTQSSTSTPAASVTAQPVDDAEKEEDGEEKAEELVIRYDVPPAARRSLSEIGIISEAAGGFPAGAFGIMKGSFLKQVLQRTNGPVASRWGTIMARRLLASRTTTPSGVNGADWAAERAWLLLRMGDSVVARRLVQQVDANKYTKRLHEVAMDSFLANGDLAGMCPLSESGVRLVGDPKWKMSRTICASLAGDQGNATAFLNQGRYQGWMKGVDYRLTEKAVGAGINGRRSVTIDWENVTGMNVWRFGLSAATGMAPPERLFVDTGRQIDGWRVQLPMFGASTRLSNAPGAAALGVLSNRNMVDLYSQVVSDDDAPDVARTQADLLTTAYTGTGDSEKVAAMSALWDGAGTGFNNQGMLVLTARAAALIAPSSTHSNSADRLIASMMTAGLDNSAAAWSDVVSEGSLGWGLIVVGVPDVGPVTYSALDDFKGSDNSESSHKSAMLLAGLAGLGRLDTTAQSDFSEDLKLNVTRQSKWTRAISAAAERGESGSVALLALAGLQASNWSDIPAHHLYYIVKSLVAVGLEPEARMIAAEAVAFG